MGKAHLGFAYTGIARRLEKCYRKNPRAGFSFSSSSFSLNEMGKFGDFRGIIAPRGQEYIYSNDVVLSNRYAF